MEVINNMSDSEHNLTLRGWREKLGYGLGWTFKDALKDWLWMKVFIPILIILLLILASIISHLIAKGLICVTR